MTGKWQRPPAGGEREAAEAKQECGAGILINKGAGLTAVLGYLSYEKRKACRNQNNNLHDLQDRPLQAPVPPYTLERVGP